MSDHTGFADLVAAVRCGAGRDKIESAAAELLIWHEGWLRRADFRQACVEARGAGIALIHWDNARKFLDGRPLATTSQTGILEVAIAIGTNQFRLAVMGRAHQAAIVRAFAQALGLEDIPQAGDS